MTENNKQIKTAYVYHCEDTQDGMELECRSCLHTFLIKYEEPLSVCPKCDIALEYPPYASW